MTAKTLSFSGALATIALIALVATGCKKGGEEAQGGGGFTPPPTIVTMGKLKRGPIVEYATLVGAVRWPQRTTLKSEITGPITHVAVIEGASFKKGDVLVRVNPSDYEIVRDRAKADLTRAEVQLAQAKVGTRPEVIAQIRAQRGEVDARLQLAKSELARTKQLFADDVRTQADLDSAQATYAQTVSQFQQLTARLEEAQNGPIAEDIAVAAANVEVLRVALQAAERDLAKAEIVAPYDGVVMSKSVETGGYIRAGEPLLEIVANDHLEVIIEAPEELVTALQPGVSFEAKADAVPGVPLTCTVVAVIPEADPVTRNFRLRADVAGGDGKLLAGMFVRARMPVASRDDALIAPLDAVVLNANRKTVWIVTQNDPADPSAGLTANAVDITIGLSAVAEVELIGEGLEPGMTVVTSGGELLQPGAAVRPPPGPPGPPADAAPPSDESTDTDTAE